MNSKKHYNADIKPSKRDYKKEEKRAVFDIESNNWKEYVVGGIYDGTTFRHFNTLKGLCDALDEFRHHKIYAHFGGIFDFLFTLNYWGLNDFLHEELIMRGSSVFQFKRGTNTFIDSAGILPFSLEEAARAFKVSHQKLEIDHSKKKRITKKLLKYLEHDCVALYECIAAFYNSPIIKNTKPKATLASTSIEVLKRHIKDPIPNLVSKEIDDFVRQGYAGGRVEIIKPLYNDKERQLHHYDFNSLFPAAMAAMQVPGKPIRETDTIHELGYSDATVECPDIHLPLLWTRHNSQFLFPTGAFRGIFPGPELLEAQSLGYKIRVHKTIVFENLGKIFEEYIHTLYELKSTTKDPVIRQTAKLLLNSGYGRMGIKRERESLCIDDGSDGIIPLNVFIGEYRLAKKPTFYRGFSNPAIAGFVTAHARIKLHRKARQLKELYYMDTDSLDTPEKLKTGAGLGELKLEASTNQACFLLPKAYAFGDEIKLKGFPKEFRQSLNFEDFAQALEGSLGAFKATIPERLARIKGAKNEDLLRVLNASEKEIRKRYDKRILFKNNGVWDTKPLNINFDIQKK